MSKLFLNPRAARVGFLLGIGIGLFDYSLYKLLGVTMFIGGKDVTLWVSLFYAGTLGAMGYLIGHLIVARKELKAKAETIQNQMKELEAAQRRALENEKLAAVGRLAAGVAHEVRNPLGVIGSATSVLLEELEPDSDRYRAGEFIREEVDRLNRFVTLLLDFSKPLSPDLREVALSEIVEAACSLGRSTLEATNIGLTVPEGSSPSVLADPELMSRVVFGLLLNAVQALEDGGEIAVRWRSSEENVTLEVADDGPGVDDEMKETLFEPFATSKAGGTGLGLAMAQRIIEAHKGTLNLAEGAGAGPVGRGACYRIELPREAQR